MCFQSTRHDTFRKSRIYHHSTRRTCSEHTWTFVFHADVKRTFCASVRAYVHVYSYTSCTKSNLTADTTNVWCKFIYISVYTHTHIVWHAEQSNMHPLRELEKKGLYDTYLPGVGILYTCNILLKTGSFHIVFETGRVSRGLR